MAYRSEAARKRLPKEIRILINNGANQITITVDLETALALAKDLEAAIKWMEPHPYAMPIVRGAIIDPTKGGAA